MSDPRGCLGVSWGRGGARRGPGGSLGERAASLLQAPTGGSAAFSLQEGKPKYPVYPRDPWLEPHTLQNSPLRIEARSHTYSHSDASLVVGGEEAA